MAVFVLVKHTLLHNPVKKGIMTKVVKIGGKEPCDDPAFLGEFSRWSLAVSDRWLTPERTNSGLYCRELHHTQGMNVWSTILITEGK